MRRWIDALAGQDDALDRMVLLQHRTPDQALSALLVHVLTTRADRSREGVEVAIERFLGEPDARACAAVWGQWSRLEPLADDACDAVISMPTTVIQLWVLLHLPRTMSLLEAAGVEGLAAGTVDRWRDEVLQSDLPEDHDTREFVSVHARWVAERDDPLLGWQTRAVRHRSLRLPDLTTGRDVEPFDAVFPWGRCAYSFGEAELHLLLADGEGSRLVLLFLPARGVLVDLGNRSAAYLHPKRVSATLVQLMRRAARNRSQWSTAVAQSAEVSRDRRVVVLTSTVANPAHHVWNSYPGLDRLVRLGLVGEVDVLHTGGSEFYGAVTSIFPELGSVDVRDEARTGLRDPYPFSGDHVVVPIGSYFIGRQVVARLEHHAVAAGTPAPAVPDDQPVVWIGLRLGSRSWVDQDEVLPRLIDTIHQRHPGAVVALDGFCRPVGRDEVSDRWVATVDSLADAVAAVRAAVKLPDQVVDLVGVSLDAALLWAVRADAYLTPLGTSQHRVGWFSQAEGVVYGPPSLASVPVDQWPGSFESEGRPIPAGVIGEVVSVGEGRTGVDRRLHDGNVRLPESEVFGALLRAVDRGASRRST